MIGSTQNTDQSVKAKPKNQQNFDYLDLPSTNDKKRIILTFSFIALLLVIDQVIKFSVKLNMMLGESIKLADWGFIYFTENPGMAFGWEFFDKIFLTTFRILASIFIAWLLVRAAKRSYSKGFLVCMAAIFAGAVGNILDSIFYGQLFTSSSGVVAEFATNGNGYASWMHGKVVDMFYFPIINTYWPNWMPVVGGNELIFFRPIFNFADACISVGVVSLLVFYSHSFAQLLSTKKSKAPQSVSDSSENKELK